jgi:hypothetical protein
MSNTPSGLQTDRFVESFTKPGTNTNLVYTTEDFVNSTVKNYLNTNSSVDIRIGNGVSFSALTGTTETVVTIGLDAGLGNLNNVDLSGITPGTSGPYLFYDGTSWVAGSGLSITDTEITDLKNVEGTVKENSVLFSANGTSLFFKEDKTVSIDNLRAAHTRGIVVRKNSSYPYEANIQTRFLNFPTVTTDNSTDFYTVTDPATGITRKIEKGDITVSDFNGFDSSVQNTVNNYLQSSNNATGSDGLCYLGGGVYNLNLSNYLSGAGGILPISQGGTNASGAADARVNLGLSYGPSIGIPDRNYLYDIMGFSQPTFRDTVSGDNIRLVGKFNNNATPVSAGSGYINTDSNYYYITNPSTGLCYQVLPTTGPGGSVVSIAIPSFADGTGEFYNTFTSEIRNLDPVGPGSGASFRLTVEDSFINYGTGSGEDGFGLRFGTCTPQVNVIGRGWEEINRLPAVEELTNVTESSTFTDGDFLIYNGSCFQPYQISGDITIGASGVASLTSTTFGVSTIDFGVSPFTINWNDLTGTTGTVQTQLNQKLSYTGPAQTEQGILLLDEGSSTRASVITYDPNITPSQNPL